MKIKTKFSKKKNCNYIENILHFCFWHARLLVT